jgi:hypothetical protein
LAGVVIEEVSEAVSDVGDVEYTFGLLEGD